MAKRIADKNLADAKVYDFSGIQDNIDPLSDRKSVVRCTNLEPHVEPGKFTLRPPYQLKYKHPTDLIYQRSVGEEFISFDNFYEKTAKDQAEVTVLVSKSEINAPMINGSRITPYKFLSTNIYIRPHWTGSYWNNSWMWLNEPIITKIHLSPDAPYRNMIQVVGYFGNLLQWTLINVTKDKKVPYAILRSALDELSGNTNLWLSVYDPNFDINDEVVLMRNYIPIKYLIQNYNVLREEISFHRVLSRMRIGFGAKEGRVALGVEYAHNTLRLADYNFTATDPLMDKLLFANVNRVIVQPYIAFNEEDLDYDIVISRETGSYAAGTYYFRMTAVLDVNEVLVKESSITVDTVSKFQPLPRFRAGSLSRRLKFLKIYFSENNLDFYLWKSFPVTSDDDIVIGSEWLLANDGYLNYSSTTSAANLHTESNAASAADANSLGSWTTLDGLSLTVVAATNFALEFIAAAYKTLRYPISVLSASLIPGRSYSVMVNHKGSTDMNVSLWIKEYVHGGDRHFLGSVPVTTSFVSHTFVVTIPENLVDGIGLYYLEIMLLLGGTYTLEEFSIIEEDTALINAATDLGAEMNAEIGYQATFNLVKDWQNATYLNGRTYVAPALIERRYDTNVWGSQISGDGANMHDVIPAGGTVFPVDEYRGEVVTGIIVMHNLNIAVFTDGGLIILDPDTGNTREVARGYGLKVKGSLVLFRGSMIYGSDDDFIRISAASGYEAEPISTRSVRKIYNNLPNKLLLSACFDRFGTYHVSLGEDADMRELLLTDRGWINQDRDHHPQVFRNGLGGRVWFLNEGDIYAMPYNEEEFIGYADLYGDYRAGW